MIGIAIVIEKKVDLTIKTPDASFWGAIASDTAKTITKRTLSGMDYNGKQFRPYSESYKVFRADKKRQVHPPNLTFSGRMLKSIRTSSTSTQARIWLSGEEGWKAFQNEEMGRQFFDVSNNELDAIVKRVEKWMSDKNGM